MLSNNGLYLLNNNGLGVRAAAEYVLLILVLAVNSTEIHTLTLALYALLVTRALEDATSRSFVGKINLCLTYVPIPKTVLNIPL